MTKNERLVREILEDEITGRVKAARKKMSSEYSMTWMYRDRNGKLFPRTRPDFGAEMEAVYKIKGRSYDIRHIAEGKGVVMVELVESYSDPKSKKVHRTPLVLVLELKGGKIKKGRHYCDPSISHLYLPKAQIRKAFQ